MAEGSTRYFSWKISPPPTRWGPANADRLRTLIAHGDLGNQLLENGIRKGLIVLGSDHECAGTADDVVGIVSIEPGLDRKDRQAIDADAGADGIVAGEGDQSDRYCWNRHRKCR